METKELINRVSVAADSTKGDAKIFIFSFLDVLSEALAEGEKIKLRGFGTFEVNERKQCQTKHPDTGEAIDIPAHNVCKFTQSRTLKKKINGEKGD